MARVIAIPNQKGGVGKTTTAATLSVALYLEGYRVLVLDFDPQANLTTSLGVSPDDLELHMYHVMTSYIQQKPKNPVTMEQVSLVTESGVVLVPTNRELARLDTELVSVIGREQVLKRAIAPVRNAYDFIIIDCPPAANIMTINALTATDEIVVPLQAEFLALNGVDQILDTVDTVQQSVNNNLRVTGVVITMADYRTRNTKQVIDTVRENLEGRVRVFDSVIRDSVRVKEAPIYGQTVLTYDPKGKASEEYRALAREVLNAR